MRNRTRLFAVDDRRLSVIVFSLFFSWLLAVPFQGQILYSLAERHAIDPRQMVFGAIAAHFVGLFSCGFFVKRLNTAKRLMLCSVVWCIAATATLLLPPSLLWTAALISGSLLTGGCVAAWGFYLRCSTPRNQRIKTIADGLIGSNVLMIALNVTAIYLSPHVALGVSILVLAAAFRFALQLPAGGGAMPTPSPGHGKAPPSIAKPLAFLYLFVLIITVDSGLMYQVLNPAYAHHTWLASWYWAVPYIAALLVMRNLPRNTNRAHILYVALAMIGLSFIAFVSLDRSVASYLLVDTLMLGACGVYDLFWWSILGEMLDLDRNPARVLGIGLSANVLGVLVGGLLGQAMASPNAPNPNTSLLALAVVCVAIAILPPLHKYLASLLKDHTYLAALASMAPAQQSKVAGRLAQLGDLSERERQVAARLLQGKTYRMIAGDLHISENTVKTHTKNIYAKLYIQSRAELVDLVLGKDDASPA